MLCILGYITKVFGPSPSEFVWYLGFSLPSCFSAEWFQQIQLELKDVLCSTIATVHAFFFFHLHLSGYIVF